MKPGDILTSYFQEQNFETTDPPVNRLAYYIDKGSTPVFIFSPSQIYLAYFLLFLSFTLVGKVRGE